MMGADWVDVRLTKFGEEHAQGGQLRVQEGSGFVFQPGIAQRVTRVFDWERVLKPWHINGHALFQIVETSALNAPGADAPGDLNQPSVPVMGTASEEVGK